MFLFRRQPLKGLYLTYFALSTFFVRLPYWIISSIFPASRPRRSWSFGKSLGVAGMRAYVNTFFETGLPFSVGNDPDQVATLPNAAEIGFTWVPPLPEELIVGEVKELATMNGVEAMKTSGYWMCKGISMEDARQPAQSQEKIILYLHSGGHIMGSAHPNGGPAGPACQGLLENCSSIKRIFSCSYRLSSSSPFPAENPFPAGLLDALSGYHYLLNQIGVTAENIIVYGDSSGANVALALTRYLTVNAFSSSTAFPIPGALLLVSPTVEWAMTHIGPASSWKRNVRSDYSQRFFEGYTQKSLLGKLPPEMAYLSPWISPGSLKLPSDVANGMFQGFPRTYIVIGGGEMAFDSALTLRNRMVACIGGSNVKFVEVEDGTHDIVTMTFFEPERTQTLKGMGTWVDAL